MKKKHFVAILIIVIVVAMMSVFTGCAPSGDNTDNSKPDDAATYNVVLSEGTTTVGGGTLVTTIETLRQQVVDVYAANSAGTSAGSGVIISSGDDFSMIITNHHVIEDCYEFEVDVLSIEDNTESLEPYSATLIGSSPKDDIAVLRVNQGGLTAATWVSDSSTVKVGTEVLAIGNPLGILGGTVTKGIISATARAVEVDSIGIMTLMQTDAAINSGNSGGGLFSIDGLLIGIVNSGYTDYEGLNFAIPANDAKSISTSLIETYSPDNYGYVLNRTNIGLSLNYATVYASSSRQSKIDVVYVAGVTPNSDAASAINLSGNFYSYAVSQFEYDGVTYSYDKDKHFNIKNYYLNISKLLGSVETGKTVTLTLQKIIEVKQETVFPSYYYYLDSATTTATITATQYIYNPPSPTN